MSAIRLENVPGIIRETRVKVRQPDVRRKWGFWQQLKPEAGKKILERAGFQPVVSSLSLQDVKALILGGIATRRKVREGDLPQVADGMIPSASQTLKRISKMRGSEPQKSGPRPFTLEEVFENAGIQIPQELNLDLVEAFLFIDALDNSSRAEIFRQVGKELLAALKEDLRERRGDRITDRGITEFLSGGTLKYVFYEIAKAAVAEAPKEANCSDATRALDDNDNVFSRVGGWIISSLSINKIRDLYLTFFLDEVYSRLLFRAISPKQRVALFDLLDAEQKTELHETVGETLTDLLDGKELRKLYVAHKDCFSSEHAVQEVAGKLRLSKRAELFMALTPREKGEFLSLIREEESKVIFAVMSDQEIKSVWEEIRGDEKSIYFFLRSMRIEKLRVLCQSLSDADREVVIRISTDSAFAGFVRLSNLIGSRDAYRKFSPDDRRDAYLKAKEEDRQKLLTLLDYEDLHDLFNLLSAKDKLGFAALVHTINPRFYKEYVLPYLKGA